MSTFAQLQTLVQERVGVATTDAAVGTANTGPMAGLVKAALRSLDTTQPSGWNWQRVTGTLVLVAAQEEYAFTSVATAGFSETCRKIVEVKVAVPQSGSTGQFPLKRLSRSEADALYPYTSNQVLQCWWTEGLVIGFRPVPDLAYSTRITFIRGERELTAGGDIPYMPIEWHDAIVERAAEMWYRRVHDTANAQIAAAAAAEWVKKMSAGQRPYTGAGRVLVENDGW